VNQGEERTERDGEVFSRKMAGKAGRDRPAWFPAKLFPNFVACGEDFFNAEDAKVGAEFRRESFSSATSALNRVSRFVTIQAE
jgi:hypothetical protein